jgi:Domain of unknown function (DUF4349)
MRRITATVAALLLGVALVACSGSDMDDSGTAGPARDDSAEQEMADEDAAAEAAEEPDLDDSVGGEGERSVSEAVTVDPSPRQIIYTIDLSIETEDVARAAARAAALAETAGGFVSRETTHGAESATLTLRVPSARHSGIVSDLESLGEVHERSRTAEDVTSEVVDLEARIASARRSIDRIRELLDAASDLSDVVRIESELARREADLDSLLQRQEQLSSLTSLATVTVTFFRPDAAPAEDGEPIGFLSGLAGGWSALVASARVFGAVVGALLPFLVVGAVVGWPAWLAWRRLRRGERPAAPAVPVTQPGEPG